MFFFSIMLLQINAQRPLQIALGVVVVTQTLVFHPSVGSFIYPACFLFLSFNVWYGLGNKTFSSIMIVKEFLHIFTMVAQGLDCMSKTNA